MHSFRHSETRTIRLADGSDERAPGGAVTLELCGSWNHEGPCRWPHLTEVEAAGNLVEVRVAFDADTKDELEVRDRIRRALESGRAAGPDGQVNTWQVVGPPSS